MSNSDTKLSLISCDGEKFEIERKVAMWSQQLANMIEDDCAGIIPVPNVTASILAKVLEYCEKHVVDESSTDKEATDEPVADASSVDKEEAIEPVVADDPLETWDNEFVKVDSDTLYDLLLAANYLNVEGLLNLLVQTIADMIKGKTTEELRKTFNIVNDFTPEEEEEIRKENKWAFE